MTEDNVIYIDTDTWYYMRMLRESVKDAQQRNPKKFKTMIDTHGKFYRQAMREVLGK
jgi:hypothetical protein